MYILKELEDEFMCTVRMYTVQKPDGQTVLQVLGRVVANMKLWGEEVEGQLTFLRSCLADTHQGKFEHFLQRGREVT